MLEAGTIGDRYRALAPLVDERMRRLIPGAGRSPPVLPVLAAVVRATGPTMGRVDHPTGGQPNRLIDETSPYLLQHARDPVDWYPWGAEALTQARALDRPVFLSVGYAACHWCHVMHRESFADAATAQELNAGFVSIKVDREERPDVDHLYMDAVQSLTGSGGWPMSMFLTPDGRPFYGGTYFPATPHHGLASFRQVLAAIGEAWAQRRDEIEASATTLADAISRGQRAPSAVAAGTGASHAQDLAAALDAATSTLSAGFDARTGGWGGSPKFPQPMVIEQLIREHLRTGDRAPLQIAERSLDAMAAGGIRDHLGGGFARYATDSIWLVPHFEKMLYDNAQLALTYLHAWQLTGAARHAVVAQETLSFMARELTVLDPGGIVGLAASLDADTDGEEGLTYVWTSGEVNDLVGPDASLFGAAYGVTPNGNWEGRTILSRVRTDDDLARMFSMTLDDVTGRLAAARGVLLNARGARPQPGRDDKVLASWNGLALAAFAEAGRVLPDGGWCTSTATDIAAALHRRLRTADGRLHRSWKDGKPGPTAVLEDHTHLCFGLLALYQTTFEERWLLWALELMDSVVAHFTDPEGGFHDTADDADRLFARPRGLVDSPLPSGNAMAVSVLLQLAALTGRADYRKAAAASLGGVLATATRHPTAFAQWLIGAGTLLVATDEVAIVGPANDHGTRALVDVVRTGYRPWQVVAWTNDPEPSSVPLLSGRSMRGGAATAYVCHGFSCQLPVTTPDELLSQLRAS